MRRALTILVALCLLGVSACTSDSPNQGDPNALGVSPVVPNQIEGGSGWR
ncbi:MAG: hypothetical protein QNJ98_06380 [Planctomycetota bacterium]|nr:hypothetical protein [Planctomycetota bacterium]